MGVPYLATDSHLAMVEDSDLVLNAQDLKIWPGTNK